MKEQVLTKITDEEKPEPITEKPETIDECVNLIVKITTDSRRWPEEELDKIGYVQERVRYGDPLAVENYIVLIKEILEQHDINIEGIGQDKLAEEIYKKGWGLDIVHDLFYDPDVYEVYVDRPEMISVSRKGVIERIPHLKFRDENHVNNLIQKMIAHDKDAHFDESVPRVQSVRGDDSRLTAYRKPLTEYTCFVLRKLNAVTLTREYLLKEQTVNEKVWDIIALLARYGAKILFIGPPESGKTSWIRLLVGILEHNTRTVSIEPDRELGLRRQYPDRTIVEMEEHRQLAGGKYEELFAGSLRLSATNVIFGEFRLEEIDAAIMAGERSRRFWSTSHFENPQEAVSGIADLLISRGSVLSHLDAEKKALRAFNTYITLFGDAKRGVKKVIQITHAFNNGKETIYKNLVKWKGSPNDHWDGEWEFPDLPTENLLETMRMYGVTDSELIKVGWL